MPLNKIYIHELFALIDARNDFLEVVSHLLTFSHFFFRLTVLNNITGGADLAVLQLDRPAVFSDTVWPVCLPAPSDSILLEEVRVSYFKKEIVMRCVQAS